MKKLLFIILTLFSISASAQVIPKVIRVQGVGGAKLQVIDTASMLLPYLQKSQLSIANNETGDSLIWTVANERHAIKVATTVDLSNYYNKTQVDNSLNGKLDTSYKQSITAIKPLHWNVITPDSATIGLYIDTTSDLSDNSDTTVPSTKAVKNYVDNQINTVTSEGVTRPELIDTANNKVNISDTAAMLAPYLHKNTVSGGTINQVLKKNSSTDYDWSWQDESGGGGGAEIRVVIQTYTGSSSVTVADSTTWLIINPASLAAATTITLPESPTNGQDVVISFGGTITSGTVVTALTISPNTGQSILQASTPSLVESGETIKYRYEGANKIWYRL